MKIRFTGKKEYIELLRNIFAPESKIYKNRNSEEYRLYLEISEEELEKYITLLAGIEE